MRRALTRAHPEVPAEILRSLRLICLDLPEAYEEPAWVGIRWMVKKKNFAHVLMIDSGWPPAYARAAKRDGPACVLTFRSPGPLRRFTRPPYFRPPWFADIVGLILDADTDWEDIAPLVLASYRVVAPKKLSGQLER